MSSAILPSSFSYKRTNDLIRLGQPFDGGYVVSKADIMRSESLLAMGISDDWSFEQDFLKINPVALHAYDASVSAKYFFKQIIKSCLRIDNLNLLFHWIKTFLKYRSFFSSSRIKHFQKFVGLNTEHNLHCTFEYAFNKIQTDNVFIKIDVEGSEYRFLDSIIENQKKISGLIIEFHNCDIHLQVIEKFISEIDLNLVHIHANNHAPLRLDDCLPLILELTFSKYGAADFTPILPHELDMPNNKKKSEIKISICDR